MIAENVDELKAAIILTEISLLSVSCSLQLSKAPRQSGKDINGMTIFDHLSPAPTAPNR
jgi:hypothetical protein